MGDKHSGARRRAAVEAAVAARVPTAANAACTSRGTAHGPAAVRWAVLALLPWRGLGCCPNSCSGHGFCAPNAPACLCRCDYGYTGGDCTLRTCPDGFAWSDMATAPDTAHARAECSNAGICNRETGACLCSVGFEGPACERMSCPGGPDLPCNAHGVCMSMRNYATTAPAVADVHSYSVPWDADKVFGCHCDAGYTGHDCMNKPCPVGDDPLTTGQTDSTQIVHCNASHGTFRLSFLGESTVDIVAGASREAVETAINALESISGAGGGGGGGGAAPSPSPAAARPPHAASTVS